MTYVREFIKRRHSSTLIENSKTKHTELVESTETLIIQSVQQSVYHQEIKKKNNNNSSFLRLDPFIDKDWVILVGRLLTHFNWDKLFKKLVIIPAKQHVPTIIQKYHCEVKHQGRHLTADMSVHPPFGLSVVSDLYHHYYINMLRVENSEKELTFKRWISYQKNGLSLDYLLSCMSV